MVEILLSDIVNRIMQETLVIGIGFAHKKLNENQLKDELIFLQDKYIKLLRELYEKEL